MSYLVLARKWRPRQFAEVVGQPHVVKTLLNGLRQGRLAHAYLFSGPRGVGKTTTARLLAKAINCRNQQDGEPCGECASCVAIGEGNFIDTVEIDAASNTGVDDIRKLREGIRYAPIEGTAKMYIIDEVHMLSQGAFNALLKTLEEPPEHAYFCLATTEPQKIPATIMSRCQRFDFRRVPAADIRAHLERICRNEEVKFEIEALDLLARRADGSVRDGLSLLDQVIAYSGGSALKPDAVEVVGEIRHDLYRRAVELVESKSPADAFRLDGELASVGTDPQDFIVGLEAHIIQLLQVKALGVDQADLPSEVRDDFARVAERLSEADLVRLLQICSNAETDVRRNFNPRARLQLLLLRFAAFERSVALAEVVKLLAEDSRPSASGDTEPKAQPARPNSTAVEKPGSDAPGTSTPPLNGGENPLATVQAAWDGICERIAEDHNSRGPIIQYGGFPVAYDNGRLRINFPSQTNLKTARECLPALKRGIEAVIGAVQLDLEIGDIPQRGEESPADADDPALKMLIDRFGGTVVK